MRKLLIGVCLSSALAVGVTTGASAGGYEAEPQVVPGIGPESSPYGYAPGVRMYDPGTGYVSQPRMLPQAMGQAMPRVAPQDALQDMRPVMRQPIPAAARMQQPVVRPPRYGGGLLDALMGGSDQGQVAAPPTPGLQAYAPQADRSNPAAAQVDPYGTTVYASRPIKLIDPMYQRQQVAYNGPQAAGTIVVDTKSKFLYLVEGGGQATRYGIGVGKPGFLWAGTKTITRKAEWPDWTPPPEMRQRRPDLPFHMVGGIANPLGARAMYLGSSLYRIHGTNEPETIGTNVSSGCIRLTNEDVSDLYGRVRVGTRVVVL